MPAKGIPKEPPHIVKERLVSLQYLRGIAALMVVLTHSSIYLKQVYGYDQLRLLFGDYWSYFGVISFFCLSGFLLTSLVMKTSWQVFILHRLARIFPVYLLALSIALMVFWVFDLNYPHIDWRIFLLVPIGPQAYRPLHVEWTLIYEMAYYAVLSFFCVVIFRRHLFKFYILWFICLVLVFLKGVNVGHHMLPNGGNIFLTSWNIAFICGGLAWMLSDKQYVKWWMGLLGIVLILSCTIHPMVTAIFAPAGVALLIAFIIHMERDVGFSFKLKILERFGNWSYAMYLIHVPVLLAVLPILLKHGNSPLSAWFSSLGIILLVTACLGEMDLYMYRKLKKYIDMAFAREGVDGKS